MTDIINAESLRHLANENPAAAAYFELLMKRKKNTREARVDRVVTHTGCQRSEVVDMFKKMEELGLGRFIVGRKGSPSRFEWHVFLTDVAQVYAGEDNELEIVSPDDLEEFEEDEDDLGLFGDDELLEHRYVLRAGDEPIFIKLPQDLTQHEADRLAAFIKTLPIA